MYLKTYSEDREKEEVGFPDNPSLFIFCPADEQFVAAFQYDLAVFTIEYFCWLLLNIGG